MNGADCVSRTSVGEAGASLPIFFIVTLVLVGHDLLNLTDGVGGPSDRDLLFTPDEVVAEALRALGDDAPTVVTGQRNALIVQLPRLLPRSLVARISERITRTPVSTPGA